MTWFIYTWSIDIFGYLLPDCYKIDQNTTAMLSLFDILISMITIIQYLQSFFNFFVYLSVDTIQIQGKDTLLKMVEVRLRRR